MSKRLFVASILGLFVIAMFATQASAYSYYNSNYGNGYSNTYYVKDSYDAYGHNYVERQVSNTPYGEKTQYTQVRDNNGYPSYTYYNSNTNPVSNYFNYGPYSYSYNQPRYLGYAWDDSWRRYVDGSQYHTYYYQPSQYYNGQYYNWHYN